LLALLNSKLAWFFLSAVTNIARGGFLRLRTEFVEQTPIPNVPKAHRRRLEALASKSMTTAQHRFDVQCTVRRRLRDLSEAKLSRKLEEWWTLDFAAFRAEVKRALRAEIPVKERGEWEAYLGKHGAEVRALDAEIEKAEREIDAIVYRLFDLTADEIALLEASIAGQY
jgi:hypothetical protein